MKKRLLAILTVISLIITSIVPVAADNGDNWGEDIFNQPSVSISLFAREYSIGDTIEFETNTFPVSATGKNAVRSFDIEGSQDYVFEYYDGAKWLDVKSNYNGKIVFEKDQNRKFRLTFNSKGKYMMTYAVEDLKGQLLCGSRRYITITDTNMEVKLPLTPIDKVIYDAPNTVAKTVHFSWANKNNFVAYDFYVNGEKVDTVTTNAYDLSTSYFKENGTYMVGVVALNADGLESIMRTIAYTVDYAGTEETTTPEATTASEETTTPKATKPETTTPKVTKPAPTTTAKVTKPGTVKSFKVKNIKGKKVKLTWRKMKGVTGYQVMYATNKKFKKGKKTVTVKKASTASKVVKKLKVKKTYYFKMRAYKKVNKKAVYGKWTKVKKVKIKK